MDVNVACILSLLTDVNVYLGWINHGLSSCDIYLLCLFLSVAGMIYSWLQFVPSCDVTKLSMFWYFLGFVPKQVTQPMLVKCKVNILASYRQSNYCCLLSRKVCSTVQSFYR